LKALEDYKNLVDFIKRVEQTKYLITSFVKDLTSDRILYTSYRRKFYLFHSIYIKRFYNLQPFQQYDDKIYDVHFLFYIYRKDIDGKNKGIDWTNQNKLWDTDKDINKDVCIYTIHLDDKDSYIF